MKNAISWFDLRAKDIERAIKFYNRKLQVNMVPPQGMDGMSAFFPCDAPFAVGGAINTSNSNFYAPSETAGPLIYLDAGED